MVQLRLGWMMPAAKHFQDSFTRQNQDFDPPLNFGVVNAHDWPLALAMASTESQMCGISPHPKPQVGQTQFRGQQPTICVIACRGLPNHLDRGHIASGCPHHGISGEGVVPG